MAKLPELSADSEPLEAPKSLLDLYVTFTLLALQGFGGVLAVAHRMLVDRKRWLTRDEFVELLSLAQLMPGANIVNVSLMLGDRYFGWRGAMVGLAGMMSIPLVIVLMLVVAYNQFSDLPVVAGAIRGMGAVAAGLAIAVGLKLTASLRGNPMGPVLCTLLGVATIVLVAVMRFPLALVVPGLGIVGWCIARFCIARSDKEKT